MDGWSTSVRRQLLQAPKYYFLDCGVLNALRGELRTELRPSSFRYGRLFETWIILEMIRLNDYSNRGYRFAYWRTNTGLEVDLIVYRNALEPPVAIEIKSGDAPAEQDLKALLAFQKENPKAKLYCFCQAPPRTPGAWNSHLAVARRRGCHVSFACSLTDPPPR